MLTLLATGISRIHNLAIRLKRAPACPRNLMGGPLPKLGNQPKETCSRGTRQPYRASLYCAGLKSSTPAATIAHDPLSQKPVSPRTAHCIVRRTIQGRSPLTGCFGCVRLLGCIRVVDVALVAITGRLDEKNPMLTPPNVS